MQKKINESRGHEELFQEWMESVLEMSISDGWVRTDEEFDGCIRDQLLPGRVKQQQPKALPYKSMKNKSVSSKEVELLLKDMDMNELGFFIKSINNKLAAISDKPTSDPNAQMMQRFCLFSSSFILSIAMILKTNVLVVHRVKKLSIVLHQILTSTHNM